jgi:Cu2+-exporting ATPase
MSGSSAIVAINALLLKRTKLAGIKSPRRQSSGASATPAATGAAA